MAQEKKNPQIIDIETQCGSRLLTNKDLEKLVDTNDQWIKERTGISSRPLCEERENVFSLAKSATEQLLLRHSNKRVDAVIAATTTSTQVFPNLANKIASLIGCSGPSFDISAACSGFLYAAKVAQDLLNANQSYENILIIAADTLSHYVDWTDRNTCILFGDAASATLLSKTPSHKNNLSFLLETHEDKDLALSLKNQSLEPGPHYIRMNGRQVFKKAVEAMSQNILTILKKHSLRLEDIDLIVPHQANQRILEAIAQKLGAREDKIFSCLKDYGNTSAASIPLALKELSKRKSCFSPNSFIVLTAFGAGFTSGAALWRLDHHQKLFPLEQSTEKGE